MKRPNILYIHSHDTGRMIQPYGHAVPTPNLQRLAEQGVLFRHCYSTAPTCSPSRAGLLTGQAPHSSGMIGLAHRGFRLNDYSQHILATLKRVGYFTVLSGIQHLANRDEEGRHLLGYDAYLHHPRRDAASVFLDDPPDKPFFLSVGFHETHGPFRDRDFDIDPSYCAPPPSAPDTPEGREEMAQFKTAARRLDLKMGVVFSALERNGLVDNTLVICTTDHGPGFPRMKSNLTDGGIGVMLIMRGPGGFTGGKVVDGLVSHMDLFPTVCELLDIERPSWLQGVSIMPLVTGEKDEVRDEIFSEATYHAAYEPKRCVRTRRYKYIRRYDGRTRLVLPNMDSGPYHKKLWIDLGLADIPPPKEALYDLIYDPNEMNNLVDYPPMKSVLNDMRSRLEQWMKETNDPLLKGPVPAPKGARLNDPDGHIGPPFIVVE